VHAWDELRGGSVKKVEAPSSWRAYFSPPTIAFRSLNIAHLVAQPSLDPESPPVKAEHAAAALNSGEDTIREAGERDVALIGCPAVLSACLRHLTKHLTLVRLSYAIITNSQASDS